jgi:hypothetical protein
VVGVTASIALPFTALWMVLRDLTQFYFHANHLRGPTGDVFVPRFTLTGLKLPTDELSPSAAAMLSAARDEQRNIELLVPANDDARRAIDRRMSAYGGLGLDAETIDDRARAAGLLELAASTPRELLQEVAKVEYGMARHVLRTQVIVLRYVKALLALLTTAFAAFIASAVVEGAVAARSGGVDSGQEVWLAGILIVWAPVVILAVTSPVRWLDRLLRNEGASSTAIGDDRELTKVEDVTGRLALVGYLAGIVAMGATLTTSDTLTAATRTGGIVVLVAGSAAVIWVVRGWARGDLWGRLIARR